MKRERIAKTLANMEKMGIQQMLVTAPASVYYYTGVWVNPGERMVALYLSDKGDLRLYANRLFALGGTVDVPLVEYDDTEDCVSILASGVAPGKLGIDKTWPSQFLLRLMEARPEMTFCLGSTAVDQARMLKDEEELSCMRIASHINDEATSAAISAISASMTEADLAKVYLEQSTRLGAEGASFEPLICFGANCAEPHHNTDATPLHDGDSVILDVGGLYRRYCSDMTRTVFFGKVSQEQKRVYDLVCQANAAGKAAVRPGIPICEVDHAARKVIEDAGYGKYFIHRTGHGIGLDVHEHPDASAVSQTILRPGMVFSVEPGVYLPGRFGVRVEDLVAVTEDGCEVLNALNRDLQVI